MATKRVSVADHKDGYSIATQKAIDEILLNNKRYLALRIARAADIDQALGVDGWNILAGSVGEQWDRAIDKIAACVNEHRKEKGLKEIEYYTTTSSL